MKALLLLICVASSALATGSSRAEDNGELMTIWTSVTPIDGTILKRYDTSTAPLEDKAKAASHKCTIVYVREKASGESNPEVDLVEVMRLPWLKGESYKTRVIGGELRITTSESDRMVATLNLRNIAPTLLTRSAEQDGADQPATAPESKPQGKENSKPESEVRPQ